MGCNCHHAPLAGYPNVVRAPDTPLYQLGWLGDDGAGIDMATGLPYGSEIPSESAGWLPAGSNQEQASIWAVENLPGVSFTPQASASSPFTNITRAAAPAAISSIFSSIFGPKGSGVNLPPGPSPRVTTFPTVPDTMSMRSAIPLLAVATIAIVLGTSMVGKGRR